MVQTVLLVDSSEASRGLAGNLLKQHRYEVLTAGDGPEALKLLDCCQIDLVVSSLELPQLAGVELIRRISDRDLNVPVILLTSLSDEKLLIQGVQAGAASVVPRLVQAQRLIKTVERVLRRAAHAVPPGEILQAFDDRIAIGNDPEQVRGFVDQLHGLMLQAEFGSLGERICVCEALEEMLQTALEYAQGQIQKKELEKLQAEPTGRRYARYSLARRRRQREKPREPQLFVSVRISPDELSLTFCTEGSSFNKQELTDAGPADSAQLADHLWMTVIQAIMSDFGFDKSGRVLCLLKQSQKAQALHAPEAVPVQHA